VSARTNGGPMHPITHCGVSSSGEATSYQVEANWTVRDEFAARALAALINHDGKDYENRGEKAVPILAQFAYEYADAMMAEREKEQS
jgi:hypothetical protein